MVGSQGKMMRPKPADIDHIIDLIKQITDALTKRDFLTQQEQSQLQRYHSYENWLKLDMDMSRLNSRPFNKQEDERRRNEISYNPNVSQQLKDKLSGAQKEHIDSTIKPLQKKLDLYLTPRWHELLALITEANQFRQEIESFLSYQFDCRTIERFLRAVSGVYGFDDALLASKEKVVPELQRIKAKLEYKQAETEHDIKPVKESKSKSLVIESQSARTTALLSAAADLEQIASNFEEEAKRENDRFRRGVSPAKAEWWIENHLVGNHIAAIFDCPFPLHQSNGLSHNKKEFSLIIDTFRQYMPSMVTPLEQVYNNFLHSIKRHLDGALRAEREGERNLFSWCGSFVNGTIPPTVRRLRHIAEMVRKELAKPTEAGRNTKTTIGAIIISLSVICIFALSVWLIPFTPFAWLKNHPHSYGLQGGIVFLIISLVVGLLKPQRRNWCWGVAGLAFVVLILSLA